MLKASHTARGDCRSRNGRDDNRLSLNLFIYSETMRMTHGLVPLQPKIYHITHVDRLPSIVADGFLWCDAEVNRRASAGTTIGMSRIKQRRLNKLLSSYHDLHVGDCVPFYFCPRSVMLYLIYRGRSSGAWLSRWTGPDPAF